MGLEPRASTPPTEDYLPIPGASVHRPDPTIQSSVLVISVGQASIVTCKASPVELNKSTQEWSTRSIYCLLGGVADFGRQIITHAIINTACIGKSKIHALNCDDINAKTLQEFCKHTPTRLNASSRMNSVVKLALQKVAPQQHNFQTSKAKYFVKLCTIPTTMAHDIPMESSPATMVNDPIPAIATQRRDKS